MGRSIVNKVLDPVLLVIGGGVAVLIGGIFLAILIFDPVSDLEQLRPVPTASPNEAAYIEGRVSAAMPRVYKEFVAYVREAYKNCGRTSCWVEVARDTPPLVIETNVGSALVVNSDYLFETADVTIEEEAPTFTQGAIQARGFTVGSPVVAIGVREADGTGLIAEVLYADTREALLKHQAESTSGLLLWGGGLFLGGLAAVAVGVLRFVR